MVIHVCSNFCSTHHCCDNKVAIHACVPSLLSQHIVAIHACVFGVVFMWPYLLSHIKHTSTPYSITLVLCVLTNIACGLMCICMCVCSYIDHCIFMHLHRYIGVCHVCNSRNPYLQYVILCMQPQHLIMLCSWMQLIQTISHHCCDNKVASHACVPSLL